MIKHNRNTYRRSRPDYVERMQQIRRSGAAGPHTSARHKGTRREHQTRAIDSGITDFDYCDYCDDDDPKQRTRR